MTQLQLSDVQVGTIPRITKFVNGQGTVEVDPFQAFIDRMDDRKFDYGARKVSQSLFYRDSNIPEEAEVYHKNYMEYLQICWGNHLGIVVSPDILWYTALCQLATIVKANAEQYRHLFTTSDKKQNIVVFSGSPIKMPLSDLVDALRPFVPNDTDLFLPEFSTSNLRSQHAFNAAFCDMCSPFYNYMMLMCGFPAIDVRGTADDYSLMAEKWTAISKLFTQHVPYMDQVQAVFDNCVMRLADADWWREIFQLERCGSGGDVKVHGWFTDLFLEKPKVAYPENFSPCVSIVDYKQLQTQKEYRMQDGLLFSRLKGDFLIPGFAFTIHEKMNIDPEAFLSSYDMDNAYARLQARAGEHEE